MRRTMMRHLPQMKSAVVGAAVAALLAAGASACASSSSNNGSGGAAGGGTLTIQGDAGNPALTENFTPFQTATELHGTYLIYEPLEITSPGRGSHAPHLAPGYRVTNPPTPLYTTRPSA